MNEAYGLFIFGEWTYGPYPEAYRDLHENPLQPYRSNGQSFVAIPVSKCLISLPIKPQVSKKDKL